MNKNLLRSILLIITYSVVLVLVLVKIDLIWAVAAQILGALKPLFLGFAIAFVLNRPCTFFFRLYHGGLAGRKLDRFSRPLAVLSAYVALVVVVTALFSFVLPQVADSIRLFVSSLSGYMANLQALADEVFALFDREGVDFSSLNEYLRRVLEGVLNTATNAASHVLVITGIVDETPDIKVIYPMHKNPAVREMARACFGGQERIHMIEPLDVLDFHNVMAHAYLIMTDSGGIQEEAPALGKPVLVMRDTTERPEGVVAGTLKLVGTDENTIYAAVRELLTDPAAYHEMEHAVNPYGDGHASRYIADILAREL